MEFGLQDEIGGSLRQWVTFDDIEGIRRHYPELVQLVQTEMLSGWGVSTHSAPPVSAVKVKLPQPKKKTNSLLIFILFLILGAAGCLGFLLVQDGQLNNLMLLIKDRTYFTAQTLYSEGYNARFEAHMDRNRGEINQAMRKKRGFAQWIPFVRAVAFEKDGRWEGLSARRLRGKIEEPLPQDCSMNSWEQRWSASREQWARFLEGSDLPQQEWASILVIDPQWIRTRTPMAGWIRPGSYHEACLSMALKALQRHTGGDGSWEAKVFVSRLRWQLGFINGQSLNEDFEMSGTLWALSCIEDSHETNELKNCLSALSVRQTWRDLLDHAMARKRIQIVLENQSQLDEKRLESFITLVAELEKKPSNGLQSFQEELSFYQEIVRLKGNVQQARNEMQKKLPNLHFEL
jgi:hypothetical protein